MGSKKQRNREKKAKRLAAQAPFAPKPKKLERNLMQVYRVPPSNDQWTSNPLGAYLEAMRGQEAPSGVTLGEFIKTCRIAKSETKVITPLVSILKNPKLAPFFSAGEFADMGLMGKCAQNDIRYIHRAFTAIEERIKQYAEMRGLKLEDNLDFPDYSFISDLHEVIEQQYMVMENTFKPTARYMIQLGQRALHRAAEQGIFVEPEEVEGITPEMTKGFMESMELARKAVKESQEAEAKVKATEASNDESQTSDNTEETKTEIGTDAKSDGEEVNENANTNTTN